MWTSIRVRFGSTLELQEREFLIWSYLETETYDTKRIIIINHPLHDSLDIVPSYCSTIYSFRKTVESGIMRNKRAQGPNYIRENPDTIEKIGKKIKIVEEVSSWKFSNFGTIAECSLHHLRMVVSMAMDKYCTCS